MVGVNSMTEENTENKEEIDKEKKKEELREQARKEFEEAKKQKEEGLDKPDYMRDVATRNILEQDALATTIDVTFETTPDTERTIKAKKPSNDQLVKLLSFPMVAQNLGNVGAGGDMSDQERKNAEKALEMYSNFAKMAADLTIDETLDEKFWGDTVPDSFLQSFIMGYIKKISSGVVIPEEEMKRFRSE